MPKIPIIKPKDFLLYLMKFGCDIVNVKGSHHKIINTKNSKISVIPLHSKDLKRRYICRGIKATLNRCTRIYRFYI
ncbi:MAG: type II toxin-antitoxin system HicA family toxin [Clostridia bacterium]|nr:type II toxin-antitoxin system HicA family toxin [Clostridia bacterium]